ncbi:MAG: glucan biosynthesis protein, partial [Pseudomonadota bacterium]
VHLPLVFWLQFLQLDVEWGLRTEYAVASLGTLAIGFASYAVLVRPTPIGWLLNGRKPRVTSR